MAMNEPSMNSSCVGDHDDLLAQVLLPVSNKEDARGTAQTLAPYEPEHVTTLYVIEKGEGAPDKTPVEQSQEQAAKAFAAVRNIFPDADQHTAYTRNVVDAIFETADEIKASAIVYRSRGGGRIMQFLSGDISLQLVTQAACPVIALPRDHVDI